MSNGRREPNNRNTGAAKPTRDAHGRWLPGHCPNPKGRPRKADNIEVDRTDITKFGNTEIQIKVGGKLVTMNRREALNHKGFEIAMSGKISMLKFFFERFEQRDKDIAELRHEYEKLLTEWIIENPRWKDGGIETIPLPIRTQLVGLETVLCRLLPDIYSNNVTRMLGLDDEGDK